MAEKRKKKEEEKLGWQKSVLLYAHDMLYLLLIVMLLFLLVFRIIVVSGGSMRMTLLDGDYLLLLNNTFYHTPQRGDIVVISKESFDNGKPIVKRVIATEGQTVDIDFETGEVSVDGTVLQEDYINALTTVDGGVHFLQELLYGIAQRAVDGFVVLEVGVRAVVVDVLGHVAEGHDERRAEERKLLVRVGIVKVLVQKLAELDAPRVEVEQYAKDVGNEFCLVLRRHQLAASAHSYLRLAKLRVAVIARQCVLENIHKPRIARDCLHEGGNLALAEQIFCLAHDVARVDKRLYGLVALGISDVLVCHLTVSP